MTTSALHLELRCDGSAAQSSIAAAMANVVPIVIASMCVGYGAAPDVGPATPWHEVGTDICRFALLHHIEDHFAVSISDDDRERLRTVGDLIGLVAARQ